MKRLLYFLIFALFTAIVQSCSNDDLDFETAPVGSDCITIDVSSNRLLTRATVSDNSVEESVKHLDVVIFAEDGTFKYSERISVNAPAGTVRLKAKRKNIFVEDDKYFVYVIANSTRPATDFSGLLTVTDFVKMTQVDERLHITGTTVDGAPTHFLMDGAAFMKSGSEPATPTPVVLYEGNDRENTELKVNLRRAAAKVVLRLLKGDKVTFNRNGHEGYYVRNLPYVTNVLTPIAPYSELRTPDKTTGEYFNWSDNVIEVVAYVYAHSWDGKSFYEKGTSLIVNIPVTYDGVEYENSYYQIAMSKDSKFERNHYYAVTGTINAPGAEEESVPVEIENLEYSVRDWDVVNVDVNGENSPKFLTVNRDTMKMYNVSVDSVTLQFSSSSKITVTAVEPYFIDKFGQKVNYQGGGIYSTTDGGVSGNIKVVSPIPTNNTIRYFKLTVINEDGLEETVVVEQYPLIYVTNQQGWYSYRDDFKTLTGEVTTYENKGAGQYVSVGLPDTKWNNTYSYSNNSYDRAVYDRSFWHSKFVSYYDEETGKSTTSFYEWDINGTAARNAGRCESNTNARMYHIRVTATSDEYKVGRPRMDENGYTDFGADNAELVSPSFMIASRLGAIYSSYGNLSSVMDSDDYNGNGIPDRLEIFREHCLNYVEVYKDENGNKVVLDDWRVPTRAELDIIIDLQGGPNANADAIDYLLNGYYYMSANGPSYNRQGNNNNTNTSAIRCVRDAYEK